MEMVRQATKRCLSVAAADLTHTQRSDSGLENDRGAVHRARRLFVCHLFNRSDQLAMAFFVGRPVAGVVASISSINVGFAGSGADLGAGSKAMLKTSSRVLTGWK